MSHQNFQLRVIIRGHSHLKEEISQLLLEYILEGAASEGVIAVVDIYLESSTPAVTYLPYDASKNHVQLHRTSRKT